MKPRPANKDAKIYMLLCVLFCAHTLCMNHVTLKLLLVSSSVSSKQLLRFVHGQDQKSRQKQTITNFVEFHNHSRLLNMVRPRYFLFFRTLLGEREREVISLSQDVLEKNQRYTCMQHYGPST